MKKKLPSLELTTLYWFCSISAQILKTRAIYVCPNYDNQESAWEAVLIAVCCIGFQLHWITFIILQLPLCIRLPLLLSHWISLHLPNVTPLHIIALYCTRWVQEAPPPVTSDLLPIASIASFVIVDICCCCFWYCWLFCYHQCCWWVVQTLHSQACHSQLDVELEALFGVDISFDVHCHE